MAEDLFRQQLTDLVSLTNKHRIRNMNNQSDLFANSQFSYIVDEAMRSNCATEWDISERVQQMTPDDRSRLQNFGATVRARGDYPRVLALLDDAASNRAGDSEKVYFLFGLLDEIGVKFDDVTED